VAQAHISTPKCDIFISYSREDRAWVEQFARALSCRGWSVWWDRDIPTGRTFDTIIEQALETARCAIVVWSEHAVASKWVRSEAADALERMILLPVRIDNAKLPLEFRRIQTKSLSDWKEGRSHPEFDKLIEEIGVLLNAAPPAVGTRVQSPRVGVHLRWLLTLPTIIAVAIVLLLMQWPISTRIQVKLTAERVDFAIEASTQQDHEMLGPLTARAVGVEKFVTISFEPDTMEVADPAQYDMEKDDFPASAWKPLTLAGATVTVSAKDSSRHPRVTIEGPNRNGLPAIRLDPIPVLHGSHVTLETRGEKVSGLTVKVTGQQNFDLPIREPVKLTIQHAEVRGIAQSPFQNQGELTYRIRLPQRASWIEVVTQPSGLVISPTFSADQSGSPLFRGIAATSLDFTRQARAGEQADLPVGDRVSALTANGEISFPNYPHLGTISLSKDEAIGLELLDRFAIKEIILPADAAGMQLIGEGTVTKIRTKTGQIPIEYNLNAFDKLKAHPPIAALLAIIVWLFPTLLGAHWLRKEFKR
jgi:hypothetical protein